LNNLGFKTCHLQHYRPKRILPIIVLSQLAGTSLWFAGNAILPELQRTMGLSQYGVSLVTSAVMLGFITGTLLFALLSLADRFSPVRLFFICTCLGALSNVILVWIATDASTLFTCRYFTGFFLAGIYPVGMKIAADWYEKGLGKAMGFLLGALVLGTAVPHLLKDRQFELPWRSVLYFTSLFALAGGFIMISLVGDGPFRKRSGRFEWSAIPVIFSSRRWRQAAIGYFGHMWELYTFWGFVPLLVQWYARKVGLVINIPLWSFLIIGIGCLGCIAGGYLSERIGSARVAFLCLLISGACCLLSPILFILPQAVFLAVLLIWGLTVSPDSPQFSTLVANYAPAELRGTALTVYNSIGFSISTISLLIFDRIFHADWILGLNNSFLLLSLGAFVGLPAMWRLILQSRDVNSQANRS
jgi:MFS family permease